MAKTKPSHPRLHAAVASLETVTGKLRTLRELRAWRAQVAARHRLADVSLAPLPKPAKGPRK